MRRSTSIAASVAACALFAFLPGRAEAFCTVVGSSIKYNCPAGVANGDQAAFFDVFSTNYGPVGGPYLLSFTGNFFASVFLGGLSGGAGGGTMSAQGQIGLTGSVPPPPPPNVFFTLSSYQQEQQVFEMMYRQGSSALYRDDHGKLIVGSPSPVPNWDVDLSALAPVSSIDLSGTTSPTPEGDGFGDPAAQIDGIINDIQSSLDNQFDSGGQSPGIDIGNSPATVFNSTTSQAMIDSNGNNVGDPNENATPEPGTSGGGSPVSTATIIEPEVTGDVQSVAGDLIPASGGPPVGPNPPPPDNPGGSTTTASTSTDADPTPGAIRAAQKFMASLSPAAQKEFLQTVQVFGAVGVSSGLAATTPAAPK